MRMGFTGHNYEWDAEPMIKEIHAAKAIGRPFHIMTIENYRLPKADYEKRVKEINDSLTELRSEYNSLISSGMSSEQAEQLMQRKYVSPPYNSEHFSTRLSIVAAAEGLRAMPIESYGPESVNKINEIELRIARKETELSSMYRTNASLEKIKTCVYERGELNRDIARVRDPQIKSNMFSTLENARRLFPEFRKAPEIRFIGYLGGHHRMGFHNWQSKKIDFEEIPHPHRFSVEDYGIRRLDKAGEYDEKSARLETMSHYVDGGIRSLLYGNAAQGIPKRPDLAEKIFRRTVTMTPKEFHELSEKTATVPPNQKEPFILNYLLE